MKKLVIAIALLVLMVSCDPNFNYLRDIGADKIVFASKITSSVDIYVMNLDCSGLVNLSNTNVVDESVPRWSPDGKKIAFVRALDSGPSPYTHIIVMNADGTAQTDLTNDNSFYDHPAWSPDGTKIAFNKKYEGIQVMNADGSGKRTLTIESGDWGASWSPDGTKIAFGSFPAGNVDYDIYVVNSDGSGPITRLTNSTSMGSGSFCPAWSPDGNEIAYYSYFNIYVMPSDGSNYKSLTSNPTEIYSIYPQWSPDGKRIIYYNLNTNTSDTQLFVMNADGTGNKAITTTVTIPNNGTAPSLWGFVSH